MTKQESDRFRQQIGAGNDPVKGSKILAERAAETDDDAPDEECDENPRYGPGNPDWEYDRSRESAGDSPVLQTTQAGRTRSRS